MTDPDLLSLLAARLSAAELAVALELARRMALAGDGVAVSASGRDLARVTGHAYQTAAAALASLARDGVLVVARPPRAPMPGFYRLGTDPGQWRCGFRRQMPIPAPWTPQDGALLPDGSPALPGFRGAVPVP